ncbi:lysophospholipid acyltransferase family protein [Pontibacter ruber]|uniref:Lysophospholipid acyltransferase family protein n=1 Tax=Pontibacter ruber TaxID=1343895 RepID=A0ABW5D2F5_9BACT|nr:lysophospholipid acyltransferase family protein [Pontibacter ruber]
MLYFILRVLFTTGLRVFFRQLKVSNRSAIPGQGPLLVASNHPNTFMDPIVIASLLRQQCYFIAKSTVFNSPFKKWLLRQMNLIPIHRREDLPDQPFSNEEAFMASFKALEEGKTLMIFPEGNSFNERRLRKIKTGTARIALGAEAQHNYSLGVKILPVGLNYSAPTRFRSDVLVNIGEPIRVADFAAAYQQDAQAAADHLTDRLREQLESLIVNTPTEEEDQLLRHIETVYKDRLVAEVPAGAPEHEQEFQLSKAIIKSINYFNREQPQRVAAFRQKIHNYVLQLKRLRLQDAVLGKRHGQLLSQSIIASIYLLLGFPLYLYGVVQNYIPYIIPSKIADYLTEEEEWRAPVMMTVGIFVFPLFYLLLGLLFWQLLPEPYYLVLYLLSLPLSGFFALHYWNTFRHTHGHWTLLSLFFKRSSLVNQLRQQRREILQELEQGKQEYLSKNS